MFGSGLVALDAVEDEGSPADPGRAGLPSFHWPVAHRVPGSMFERAEGTLGSIDTTHPALARVQVGIDAAVVADHHVTIRQPRSRAGFTDPVPGPADHRQPDPAQ